MKTTWFSIPPLAGLIAICFCACGDEPEWKETRGEWQRPTATSFRSQFGYLEYAYAGEPHEWELTMTLTIHGWGGGVSGRQLVGVLWGPAANTNCLLLTPREIQARPLTGTSGKPTTIPWTPPLNRPIGIALRITRNGIQGSVGGQRLKSSLSSESLTPLRLHTNGADAIFDAISVK